MNHVFLFFFNGKPGHRGPTHPILMENSIKFFFKPSLSQLPSNPNLDLKLDWIGLKLGWMLGCHK